MAVIIALSALLVSFLVFVYVIQFVDQLSGDAADDRDGGGARLGVRLRYLGLLRYQIAIALVLMLTPVAALRTGLRGMLANLLVVSPIEIGIVTWLATSIGMVVVMTSRVAILSAPRYFGLVPLAKQPWCARFPLLFATHPWFGVNAAMVAAAVVLAAPIVGTSAWWTVRDANAACAVDLRAYLAAPGSVCGPLGLQLALGVAGGLAFGLPVLALIRWSGNQLPELVDDLTRRASGRLPRRFRTWLARMGGVLLPHHAPLHRGALGQGAGALLVFFVAGLLVAPTSGPTPVGCMPVGNRTLCVPAFGFYLLILIVLAWVVPAMAFHLDRVRVPSTLVIAALWLIGLSMTRHYYAVRLPDQRAADGSEVAQIDAARFEAHATAAIDRTVFGARATPSPVPTTFGALEAVAGRLQRYEPEEDTTQGDGAGPVRPPVISAPRPTVPPERPVIVIAAQGGGIVAAAWLAEVLTHLEGDALAIPIADTPADGPEDPGAPTYGDEFIRRLAALSAVSGGSVGLVHYLASFDPTGARPAPELEAVRRAAAMPGLRANAWGFAYPDFLSNLLDSANHAQRASGASNGTALQARCAESSEQLVDRAWALEWAWRNSLAIARDGIGAPTPATPDATCLSQWEERVVARTLPLAMMNTTTVDGGAPFVIAPVLLVPSPTAAVAMPTPNPRPRAFENVATFREAYQGNATPPPAADIDLYTAARLSATFPYVSPIARPVAGGRLVEAGHRLADGGYYDNHGIATLVEWLDAVLGLADGPTKVLLISLRLDRCATDDATNGPCGAGTHRRAFEDEYARLGTDGDACRIIEQTGSSPSMADATVRDAIVGPLSVLMNARTSMQRVRNDRALADLQERWQLAAEAQVDAPPAAASDDPSLAPADRVLQPQALPLDRALRQLTPSSGSTSGSQALEDVITCVSFVYHADWPLSWQLSPREAAEMRRWWAERYGTALGPESPELSAVRRWLADNQG